MTRPFDSFDPNDPDRERYFPIRTPVGYEWHDRLHRYYGGRLGGDPDDPGGWSRGLQETAASVRAVFGTVAAFGIAFVVLLIWNFIHAALSP